MTRILNRSIMLLKYKLNNVCDADNRPANGAQITEQFLYTTIYCDCQYESVKIMYIENIVIDAIRIISVLTAYYRRIAKTMRIACVLKAYWANMLPLICSNRMG